jgi:hypothetical protein
MRAWHTTLRLDAKAWTLGAVWCVDMETKKHERGHLSVDASSYMHDPEGLHCYLDI